MVGENPIKVFVEEISKLTDAPIPFIQSAAYWTVSATLGHYFDMPQMRHARLNPNLWILLSSIPGRMRRSTIQDYAQKIVKPVLRDYLEQVERLPMEEAEMKTEQIFIEEGTPEGIIDHIQESKLKVYHMYSTEFGGVLSRAVSRDYEAGVLTLLSKLYYGEGGMMLLSRRVKGTSGFRYLPPGLYVTLFAGCQEPGNYITRSFVRQGLLRRLLICYVEPHELDRWKEPLSMENYERDQVLNTITERLKELQNLYYPIARRQFKGRIPLIFLSGPLNEINDYARIVEDRVKKDPSDANIYRQTFWEHLAKLSAIHAIGEENRFKEVSGEWQLHVTAEDLKEARSLFDFIDRKASTIVSELEQVLAKVTIYSQHYAKILTPLRESGGRMRYSELLARSGMISEDFDKVLQSLVDMRKVKRRVEGDGLYVELLEGNSL